MSLQDDESIGEDGSGVRGLQSTKMINRREVDAAAFTALTIGMHPGARLNRSLRASSDRETSSVNSSTDASSVRTMERTPTATPVTTLVNIGVPLRCVHRGSVPYRREVHNQCRLRQVPVNECLHPSVVSSPEKARSIFDGQIGTLAGFRIFKPRVERAGEVAWSLGLSAAANGASVAPYPHMSGATA